MARMYGNDESSSWYFCDSLQLTNFILDSGATCHMTPHVSYFIPGLIEDTYKCIEVLYGHPVTAKQKVQVQIKMCGDNGDTFVVTFHYVLLAPDLCDRLFLIITSINSGHTCLFHKGFARCNLWIRSRFGYFTA